jgi:hypothetical protein
MYENPQCKSRWNHGTLESQNDGSEEAELKACHCTVLSSLQSWCDTHRQKEELKYSKVKNLLWSIKLSLLMTVECGQLQNGSTAVLPHWSGTRVCAHTTFIFPWICQSFIPYSPAHISCAGSHVVARFSQNMESVWRWLALVLIQNIKLALYVVKKYSTFMYLCMIWHDRMTQGLFNSGIYVAVHEWVWPVEWFK